MVSSFTITQGRFFLQILRRSLYNIVLSSCMHYQVGNDFFLIHPIFSAACDAVAGWLGTEGFEIKIKLQVAAQVC